MIAIIITAVVVCIGVGFTCYGLGANRGFCDALDYLGRRVAHDERQEPEDDAA